MYAVKKAKGVKSLSNGQWIPCYYDFILGKFMVWDNDVLTQVTGSLDKASRIQTLHHTSEQPVTLVECELTPKRGEE